MKTGKKTLIQHLFEKEEVEQIDQQEIENFLTEYPYLAHLHWLEAIKQPNDKAVLCQTGLYAFRPSILQYRIAHETLDSPKEIVKENEQQPTPSPIQPLYTEDYFAYTQTKLPEKLENDKPPTMDQVRSFTGWLKMMKKPAAAAAIQKEMETEEEEINNNEEENGLLDGEVITESMAEIWTSHDDFEKAIAIYEKLILLNPEKKTYFASKIKALKKQ